jgi:RNA polymerase sigma-B factor
MGSLPPKKGLVHPSTVTYLEQVGTSSKPVAGSTRGVFAMSLHRTDEGAADVSDERDRSTRDILCQAAIVDPVTRQGLLEQAVLLNQSVARALAQQYQRRGVEPEDLLQVAMLGLVKAARGYQPGLQKAFVAYAVPTISGEIKRYFRDRGWLIRPPRGLQELNHAVRIAEPDLAQRLQRTPTTAEIAGQLGVGANEVTEAREAGGGYHAFSLDSPLGESGQQLRDVVAASDNPFDSVDARLTLRPALEGLCPRERDILRLRFVDNLTQENIGQRIGVSQMQVSRLLSAILLKLRARIEDQRAA